MILTHSLTHSLTYLLTYLLTHSLTLWCKIFFEKLIVTQLVKQPAFFMEPEDPIIVLTKACHWTLS